MSDLEQLGIERLKAASDMSLQYYGQPLIITDSGGKDSSVVKELALRAKIPCGAEIMAGQEVCTNCLVYLLEVV